MVPRANKISPTKKLPRELLSYIFQLCTEVDDRPELPVVLCRVCLDWTRVVLNLNPEICTYVKMSCSGPNPSHGLCAALLECARGRPITFELCAERTLSEYESRLFRKAAPRIRRFIMDPRNTYLTEHLWRDFIFISFPRLEQLEYRVNGDLRLALSKTTGLCLDHYRLPQVTRHYRVLWDQWPFGNVTCLTMKHMLPGTCPTFQDLGRMLSSCSARLKRFEYQGLCPLNSQDEVFWNRLKSQLFFFKLESLEIGFCDNIMPLVMLFAQGRAIDLKSLTLRNLSVCPDSAVPRNYQHPSLTTTDNLLNAFVHPNSFSSRFDFPALQALHLYGLDEDCDEDLLDMFLHGSNHLRQLTLFAIWTKDARNRSPIYDSLFEYLDEDALETTSPAFPHLEELTVSQGYYALRRWLRRRIHAGYPLLNRLVITTSCYQLYSDVEDKLEDLLEYAAKDVVVITDPSWCEYTFVEMERMLVKDGKLVQDFSLVPDAMVY